MKDQDKTHGQLLQELAALRERVAQAEAVETERKRLEEALQVSEERYHNLFERVYISEDITERVRTEEALRFTRFAIDRASDPVFWMGPDARFIYVNDAACRRLGYSREELLAMAVHDIDPDFPAEVWPAHWKEVQERGSFTLDSHHRTKDGQIFPVEITVNYLEFEGQEYNCAFARDITERERAEQLLRTLNQVALVAQRALTSEEIFAAAAEEFKRLGIFCTFLLANEDQSKLFPRYLSYESAALQAAEKLVGLKLEGFSIPIENVDVYRKAVRDREATFVENAEEPLQQILPGMAKRFAGQIARILGIPKTIITPLIVEDKAIGVLSVESDDLIEEDIPAITAFAHQMAAAWRKAQLYDAVQQELAERRQAEKALRESEALLSKSQAIAHIGSWELDLVANRLTWSDEVYRMFGLRRREYDATYEAFLDTVHPDDRATVDAAYTGSLREGRDTYELEHRIVRQDSGDVRIVHEKCEHVRDTSGRIVRSIGMVQDITERKQAETALRQSEEKFRTLAEKSPNMIFIHRMGRVVYANEKCEELMEYSREEFYAPDFDFFTLIAPESIETVRAAFGEHMKGEEVEPYEYTLVTKDGKRIEAIITTTLIDYEGERAILGIVTDITERARAEEERAHNQRLLLALSQAARAVQRAHTSENVYRAIGDEIAGLGYQSTIFTVTDDRTHLVLSHLNLRPGAVQAAEKLTGLSSKGYRFRLVPDSFHGRLIEEGEAVFREPASGPIVETLPRLVQPLAGRLAAMLGIEKAVYAPLKIDGKTHSVLTVMGVDLTKADVPAVTVFASQAAIALENARLYETAQQELAERKRAEEALRRSEERYRQLFEDSPISLWEEDFSAVKAHLDHLRDTGIRDFRDYFVDHPEAVVACAKMVEVLDVNKATLELYRVDSKEALRGELAKAFAPESYDAFREELIAIAEGKTAFERDAIVETLAGQTRHTLTRWSVAPGHENAFSRVLVSIIDITERKEAEDALRWRFTQLALINEIGSKLTAAPDLEQVLDLAARLVQEKFGYHHVAVFTVDRAREEIVMRARAGSYLSLFPLDYRLGTGEGMVGWVALHGERLLANNVAAEPRYINAYPALIPTRSELSVPIRVGGEVIGVLDAQSPHLAAFDENDVMVMETVADQIAVAIEDARLYEAIQRELTERRRVEEDLRRSEEKYRNIIESIPVGMHMYQLEPDGRLVFMDANPAADKILRVDNRQFVTRTVEEAFPALADSEIPATYRQVASDGQTRHWDDIYYKENQISGAFEVHAFQTSPGRMAAAFLDITERKQAEVRIRQQNEFLNSVLESLTHPFYVINANDYSVEVANSAARQGRSLEAATCYALSHQSDGPCRGREHPCPLEDVKRLKQPITVEHVHHDQDGNMRNVEVHCYPIVDDDGQVVQAIEYVLDITERKQAEQMLLQSERLAAMGRLAASVAHEINNPLQAVEGCLTLATEELADGRRLEKVERYLGIATGEIERIADIVRRVRAFYRPTVTGMQPTDVHAVLESVLALANKQLQHSHVIVERAWDDNLPTIEANPDHLKQVFLNLLLNAIDAMPDGGTLRLRTVPHTMPTSGQDPPPPAVYIEFSDTGQGMSLETQSRLFEPFFTTKEHGSGLGLYISHGIIESHKGQINVTSNEGLGSTVSILLPVEQP